MISFESKTIIIKYDDQSSRAKLFRQGSQSEIGSFAFKKLPGDNASCWESINAWFELHFGSWEVLKGDGGKNTAYMVNMNSIVKQTGLRMNEVQQENSTGSLFTAIDDQLKQKGKPLGYSLTVLENVVMQELIQIERALKKDVNLDQDEDEFIANIANYYTTLDLSEIDDNCIQGLGRVFACYCVRKRPADYVVLAKDEVGWLIAKVVVPFDVQLQIIKAAEIELDGLTTLFKRS